MKKIIFISGIHGVGKSTLCEEIKRESGLNSYSCSDLIKNNSSYVETTKVVRSSKENQEVLISSLYKIQDKKFLLDGHFCLIGSGRSIVEIEETVFKEISPIAIVNVSCDPELVRERLLKRDENTFDLELLDELQESEIRSAIKISKTLGVPMYSYKNGDSIIELIKVLNDL